MLLWDIALNDEESMNFQMYIFIGLCEIFFLFNFAR